MKGLVLTRWHKVSRPSRAALEESLRREGYRTYAWSDGPGARYGEHRHAHAEVRWVLEGHIRIGHGARVFELGPGDRLDVPAGAPHWAEVPDDAPVSYLCGEK